VAKRAITAEDLLKLAFVGEPQISPDGSKICFTKKTVNVDKNKYETHLWVADTETGEHRQFTFGEESEGGARWSPDGKYIAFISRRDKPKTQIYLLPTAGGEARKLTDLPEGACAALRWSPDSKRIAFTFRPVHEDWAEEAGKKREEKGLSTPPYVITDVRYRLDGDGFFIDQHYQLHVIDVETGKTKKLTEEKYGVESACWAPDGKRLCFVTNRSEDPSMTPQYDDLMLVDAGGGEAKKIEGLPDGFKGAPTWSPDGRLIAFAYTAHPEEWWGAWNTKLMVADPSGGGAKDLFEGLDYSLTAVALSDTQEASWDVDLQWTPDSKSLLLNIGQQGSSHVCSIPADGGELKFLTSGSGQIALGNIDRTGKKTGLAMGNALSPAEIAVGNLNGGAIEVRALTRFNRELMGQLKLSKPEEFWTESEDGSKVHGWVMKPHGFEAGKNYPCILEIHGGPTAMYGEVFFHEFQFLAAQGYVVVFSNPRGSTGYGEEFANAITGDWGNKDYVDVMAVADYAAALPFVDTAKMGVMGGSYGGYMTNWVVGHTDRFKAAITDRSVVNLLSFAGTSDFAFVPNTEWRGNAWDEIDHLWQQSPFRYIKNCKTPTMIIHSEGDFRCAIEQGEQLFAAFKRLGVQTKFVRYPKETSHGLSRMGPPDLRIHRLQQIADWWKSHLKD
jgi:dipeptidyl aminopeptidase/acylaminoacyl peptidase